MASSYPHSEKSVVSSAHVAQTSLAVASKVTSVSFLSSSVSRHGEQTQHSVRPGPAVPHPEEALRELWGRHGEFGDYQHRSEPQPLLPQGTDSEPPLRRFLVSWVYVREFQDHSEEQKDWGWLFLTDRSEGCANLLMGYVVLSTGRLKMFEGQGRQIERAPGGELFQVFSIILKR